MHITRGAHGALASPRYPEKRTIMLILVCTAPGGRTTVLRDILPSCVLLAALVSVLAQPIETYYRAGGQL